MKIRIQGNSLRLRLNRSGVEQFRTSAFAQNRCDLTPILS